MGKRSENTRQFNEKEIARLPVPNKGCAETTFFDRDCPGLVVRVYPSGEKTFAYYGRIDGTMRRKNFGSVDRLNVKEARALANEFRRAPEVGRNERLQSLRSEPTLRVVFARYVRQPEVRRLRTWREMVETFGRYVKARARVPISTADAEWLKALHSDISKRGVKGIPAPIVANRVLALLSGMFSWHLGAGKPNPAAVVERNPENVRERWLQDDEESRFLAAIDKFESEPAAVYGNEGMDPAKWPEYRRPKDADALRALRDEWRTRVEARRAEARETRKTVCDLLRMIYHSGQRAGNVRAMEWAAVDLKARTWTIQARDFKTGKPHICTLPADAIEILRRRKTSAESGAQFVFPAGNGKSTRGHFVNYQEAFHRVKKIAGIDTAKGASRDSQLRVHDLRGGFATAMATAGVNAFIIKDQLGHQSIETTMRYVKRNTDAIREGVDRMADHRRAKSPRLAGSAA